jgi:dienelactone hydrolase
LALVSSAGFLFAFMGVAVRAIADESAAVLGPETVAIESGELTLRALLWRPERGDKAPAVLFNHGSGATMETEKPAALGPLFVRHGYAFLFLYRRGSGPSADQGTDAWTLMSRELAARGQDARDRLQLQLLDEHLGDAMAGLAFLRSRPEVDAERVAVVGHSFGASLALLMAARDPKLRAVVDFAGAANSWANSQELRMRLMDAVERTKAPVFFIHAENDYSIAPGEVLATVMLGLDKPRRIEIYPAVGRTADEGHDFVYLGVGTWETDVFAFLDEFTRK